MSGPSVGELALGAAGRGIGTGFYLSGGDLTSLTFGDVTARRGLMRTLVDLETVIGLTTSRWHSAMW